MIIELIVFLIFFLNENLRSKNICDITIKLILFNNKVTNQQRKIKILKNRDQFRRIYLLSLNIAGMITMVYFETLR